MGEILNSAEYYEHGTWNPAQFRLPFALRNSGAIAIGKSEFMILGGSKNAAVSSEQQYKVWTVNVKTS